MSSKSKTPVNLSRVRAAKKLQELLDDMPDGLSKYIWWKDAKKVISEAIKALKEK